MLESAFFCFYDFSNFFLFGFLFREESVLIVEKSVKLFFFGWGGFDLFWSICQSLSEKRHNFW